MPSCQIQPARIRDQLDRILQSEPFSRSYRLRKFLRYTVEQSTIHKVDKLKAYTIAVEAFGKRSDFDPSDPYIRNIARLSRRALVDYYKDHAEANELIIQLPDSGYLASVKDPTAKQHKRGLLQGSDTATIKLLPSVAVVPFRYSGPPDSVERVVGEVVAGKIITGLSRSIQLECVSQLSTTQLRDTSVELTEYSDTLGADYAVYGLYTSHADKVYLSVEIADLSSRSVVWAETLPASIDAILGESDSVTEELITAISRAIVKSEINHSTEVPLSSLKLHTQLLAGIHFMHGMSNEHYEIAKQLFRKILDRHPDHPKVHALMSQWHVQKIHRSGGWSVGEDERNRKAAIEHAETALDLNPSHSLGLTMMGLIETQFNKNPDKGLELYRTAAHFNQSEPLVYSLIAAVLAYQDKGAEAVDYAQKAIRLSPLDPQLHLFKTCAAAAEFAAGNLKNAEILAKEAYELDPNHTSNLRTLVAVQVELGKRNDARNTAIRLLACDPDFTTSSYLKRSPNAAYPSGQRIAERLEHAGIPRE